MKKLFKISMIIDQNTYDDGLDEATLETYIKSMIEDNSNIIVEDIFAKETYK